MSADGQTWSEYLLQRSPKISGAVGATLVWIETGCLALGAEVQITVLALARRGAGLDKILTTVVARNILLARTIRAKPGNIQNVAGTGGTVITFTIIALAPNLGPVVKVLAASSALDINTVVAEPALVEAFFGAVYAKD